MKKLTGIIVTLIFIVFATSVYAGQFGPLEPYAKEGSFSFGVGYFYEDTKWDSATFRIAGVSLDTGKFRTESNQMYLQGSYAPTKGWEVYGRLGAADMKLKIDDTDDLKDSQKFFGTLGIKSTLYDNKTFSWGPFLQGTYRSNYKDSVSATVLGVPVKADFEFKNYYDINAGFTGQVKVNDFIIYGGGFYTYANAKAEITMSLLGVSLSGSDTIKVKNPVGGFLGFSIPFTKELKFNIEGQFKDRVSAGGILTYSF
ncbi:MAG: hypothetical protein NTU69_05755 [Proteobacteria bacterium]|nr:hypothetical protein [Pseudomonadota bacterium]